MENIEGWNWICLENEEVCHGILYSRLEYLIQIDGRSLAFPKQIKEQPDQLFACGCSVKTCWGCRTCCPGRGSGTNSSKSQSGWGKKAQLLKRISRVKWLLRVCSFLLRQSESRIKSGSKICFGRLWDSMLYFTWYVLEEPMTNAQRSPFLSGTDLRGNSPGPDRWVLINAQRSWGHTEWARSLHPTLFVLNANMI